MTCCNINIIPFVALRSTTIPYTGVRPTVTVAYLQPDGTLIFEGVFTQINFTTTDIIITHGGPAQGYVKLVQ